AQAAVAPPAAQDELAQARERYAGLRDRSARFQWLRGVVARVIGDAPAPSTRVELLELRDRLLERQLALQTRQHALEAQRDTLQHSLAELGHASSNVDPELRRLSEELNAELLADRFEDADVSAAAWL